MKKRVLCLVLVFVMLLPTMIVPASAYSTGMPQGIQLFVGPRNAYEDERDYEEYTDDDLAELVDISNEFIMNCINAPLNYDMDGAAIITEAVIAQMAPAGENTPAGIYNQYVFHGASASSLMTSYSTQIENYDESASTACSLKALADAQIELAERLIDAKSSVSIWFCFPVINFWPCALAYENAFEEYVQYFEEQMISREWTNNVRGFYWATETIGWSGTFNTSTASNFNNPHVMLMDAMGDLVKGTYGKEFMWMPYTTTTAGVGVDKNDVRMGYVANRSTIFDYVLLQPGYFTNGSEYLECLRRVTASATNNKVYNYSSSYSYTNSTVVGGSKISGAADIGVVMEVDSRIVNGEGSKTASFFNNNYYEYILKFDSIKEDVPIVFYSGARPSLMNNTVFNYVKNFLNY